MEETTFKRFLIQINAAAINPDDLRPKPKDRDDRFSAFNSINPIIDRKAWEYKFERGEEKREENEGFESLVARTERIFSKMPLYREIYNSIEFSRDGNGNMVFTSPVMRIVKTCMRHATISKDVNRCIINRELKLQSSVICICIALENLASGILKDFYLGCGNKSINDRQITFLELQDIGDIDDARKYIVDKQVEECFRGNFANWFEILDKQIKVTKDFDFKSDEILDILTELFQRRNLYVHADGIVNDHYIRNVSKKLKADISKGDTLYVKTKYVDSRRRIVEKVGWFIYYKYMQFKLHDNCDKFFREMNDLLLENIESGCDAIPIIFDAMMKEEKYGTEDRIISRMNKYLFYKVNGRFDEIKDEVKNYNLNAYADRYQMAKSLLLEEENAVELAINFLDQQSNEMFLSSVVWPLFSLVKQDEAFLEYSGNRVRTIFCGTEKDQKVHIGDSSAAISSGSSELADVQDCVEDEDSCRVECST